MPTHTFRNRVPWMALMVVVLAAGWCVPAWAQETAAPESAGTEEVRCHVCGERILTAAEHFDAEGHPLCAACAAARAEATPAPEPYNIWTTKHLTGDWGGARDELKEAGLNTSFLLGTMSQVNMRGGRNTHNAHETGGKMFYNFELDFGQMGLLDGATFFIRGIQTFNSGIRPDVGSLTHPFYSAGSDGDKAIEIDKYWYRQRLFDDRLEFRLGKLLNFADLFDKNEYADNYLNEFMNQALSYNQTVPVTKGLGVFVQVWPTDWLYVQGMAVDPDTDSDYNRRGTGGFDSAFHDEDRFRAYGEFGVLPNFLFEKGLLLPGQYRFGFWYDPKPKNVYMDTLGGLLVQRARSGDMGFYLSFDQMLWKENPAPKDKQGLGVFARYGFAHRDVNRLNHFWSVGAVYRGLLPTRDEDTLGFGVAQSITSSQYREYIDTRADRETVYELYYAFQVAPWLVITPDLQVITNPGALKDARDALVGGVRIKMIF